MPLLDSSGLSASLSALEAEQYSRHLKLPGFGEERQLRLKAARVLLIGAGGLGCPMGLYLAAAGVGTIGVIDFDRVDRSNLQRQVAHSVEDIGQPKVDSLITTLRGINPLITYQAHSQRLDEQNVQALIRQYDLVLDGSDNFGTRFLLADACYLEGMPLLQGAVYEYEAQMSLFIPKEGPCYRCVFQEPPQRNALAPCAEMGVLGVVPGTAGLVMATEAIKYLTGLPVAIQGSLLRYNALTQNMRHMAIERDLECPLCGEYPSITEVKELKIGCATDLSENGAPVGLSACEVSVSQASQWVSEGVFVLDVREPFEYQAGSLPGAVNWPLSNIQAGNTQPLPAPEQPLLVYCKLGQRSQTAVQQLRALGYAQAYSMSGGIVAWDGDVITPLKAH